MLTSLQPTYISAHFKYPNVFLKNFAKGSVVVNIIIYMIDPYSLLLKPHEQSAHT